MAEDNNRIVGLLMFQIKDKHSKILWVDQLVVEEKEIAKLLMNEVEKIAKEGKCIRVEFSCWSFNQNAKDIYKHLGYNEQKVIFEKSVS